MTIQKWLGKRFGGTWKYDGGFSWWCDDEQRHVSRCSAGVDEFDNELGPAQYYLYTTNSSHRIYGIGTTNPFLIPPYPRP